MQRPKGVNLAKYYTLAIVVILFTIGCANSSKEQTLSHPAISLAEKDSRLALFEPSWSPNNNQLTLSGVYLCGIGNCDYGIFILDIRTQELHPFENKFLRSEAAWTADSEVISYFEAGIPRGIYTATLDSSNVQFFAIGEQVSWSSDGRYAAIVRKEQASESELRKPFVYIHRLADGQENKVFEIPQNSEEEITGLAWSPDSNQLALSAKWWQGSSYQRLAFIVNTDGTGLRILAENIEQLGWMPDGKWLFFIVDRRLSFAPLNFSCIVTPLDIDGIYSPAISPDGEIIAFEHERNIYLLNLDELLGENREGLVCP